MLERIGNRVTVMRRQGWSRSGRIALDRAALGVLRRMFGFQRWHSESPTSARPYRRDVAGLASSVSPQTVVEVGCGLGAILAHTDAPRRVGYDLDEKVIRAARFLHRGKIDFKFGGFEAVVEDPIDVLIAVNWIHDYSPDELDAWLRPLLARASFLIVDAIESASPVPYRFYHDFAFLDGRAQRVRAEAFGEAHRSFLLFKVDR
jgi:SAM-dependent methyltransferase